MPRKKNKTIGKLELQSKKQKNKTPVVTLTKGKKKEKIVLKLFNRTMK